MKENIYYNNITNKNSENLITNSNPYNMDNISINLTSKSKDNEILYFSINQDSK